jgi:hypothetical protein
MRRSTIGWITFAWAALFAVVHAYWAGGGAVGMNGNPATTTAEQAYIGFITLLGIVAAAVAHRFADTAAPRAPSRRVALAARAGGAALLLGVAVGAARWLSDGSLGGDGASGIVITVYFLIGGLLFSALARRTASRPLAP